MKLKSITTATLTLALTASMIGCSSKAENSDSGAAGTGSKQTTLTIMSAVQTEKPGGDIEKQIAEAI